MEYSLSDNQVEIEATLMAQSVDREELDRLTAGLLGDPAIKQAFWSPSTSE